MKFIKKIIILSAIILFIIAAFSKVNAASASISSNKTSMNVGEKAKISIKYTAAAWNIQVSGAVSYSNADASSNAKNTSNSASINFKPKKVGTYTINLSGDVTDENGKTTDLSKSITITVKEKTNNSSNNSNSNNTTSNNISDNSSKPSTDATLKNLGIKPNDFTGFKKANTSYSVSVPKNVDKVSIYATPSNNKATVTGTGAKKLQIGKNTFNIKVTAEDKKTTKTYTLTITRKEEEVTTSDATLSNLGIRPKEYDFTGFKPSITSYNVSVPNDVEKITIYANAKNIKDIITGNGNKSLKVGQNKCEIKVTSEDKKKTKTYIINVTRKEQEEKAEEKTEDKEPNETTENNQKISEGLKNIEIKNGDLSKNFSQDVYSYEVTVPNGTKKLEIDTETTSEDIEVEIAGNEELKQGENIITILAHNKKDDTTSTYQITAKVENQEIDVSTVNNELKDAENKAKIQGWIIKGTIIAIIALIIIFLIERYKISQEYEEDDDEYEEEDENQDNEDMMYNTNIQYKSTASEEIRNIGLFDEQQEYEEKHRKNRRYKGRRFK